jgi:hypothetical protein
LPAVTVMSLNVTPVPGGLAICVKPLHPLP